ncbi:MAG TPA: transglutaminase family protein [Arachnia sp.]|nr:transglutaminase family protein [Arachnia sp.]HMT84988.1 transglutaminase family protein [Arachnia sp.]
MSRLRIVHRTGFRYEKPATASYNEARMHPHTREGQFVLETSLEISADASRNTYSDYWGTTVSTFEVLTPHEELSVRATSIVDTRSRPTRPLDMGWAELARRIPTSITLTECLEQTAATATDDDMEALAAQVKAEGHDVDRTALAICQGVGEAMEYRRGVTGVHSTAQEAWRARTGVCQDIAHVSLGVLRAAGIPARYVSGYLHPDREAPIGKPVVGESHAWVEWFAGEWRGYDPTNLVEIGELHVYVGHGRDYSDVPPLRGVYAGSSGSDMFVSVELTNLG